MMQLLSIVLAVVVMGGAALDAKDVRNVKQAPLAIDNGVTRAETPQPARYIPGNDAAAFITWVAVDTMQNAFGPASRGVKPIAYDSATGILGIVHRAATSYGQSSGELWYNISRDGGATWRRVGSVNSGVANRLRYPSAAIANPTNTSDTNNVLFLWAAPLLLPAGNAFGYMAYGVDFPIGAGAGVGFEVQGDGDFWSNVQIWSHATDVNMAIFRRLSGGTAPNDLYRIHTTTDFTTVVQGVPATWAASNFNNEFGLEIGGMHRNGIEYVGKWGPFAGDPNWQIVDNVGYSTSTDGGITWGPWVRPQPDWRSAPGVPPGTDWWFYGGPGAYSKQMLVDANNRVHFFGVVFDTLTSQRSIIEVYETGAGWAGKVVTDDLKESTLLNYPGAVGGSVNQMGNHLNGAMSRSGDVMALVWLDAAVQGDTLPDIWFSWRRITDANWATPVNLTQTPNFAELLLHAAPELRRDGPNSYTIFIGRCYEAGVTTYPPESGNRTVFYAGSYSWTLTGVNDSRVLPASFSLEQNYPNPFNPSTMIRFSVPKEEFVTLKVYNMLGQEVKTLVNEVRWAGTHEVVFDAAGLPSGVYLYKLSAGRYLDTKKMVLMK